LADLIRATPHGTSPDAVVARLGDSIAKLDRQTDMLLLEEARAGSARITAALTAAGAPADLTDRVVRLFELDGAVGLAALGAELQLDETALTRAYTQLGQALGLDWAQAHATRLAPSDPWERLLVAGLVREFEQLRLEFLTRRSGSDPEGAVAAWLAECAPRVGQFKATVDRARHAAQPSAAMLAQLAGQARVLLGR
jgi:glutamate dehydrogenase